MLGVVNSTSKARDVAAAIKGAHGITEMQEGKGGLLCAASQRDKLRLSNAFDCVDKRWHQGVSGQSGSAPPVTPLF